MNLTGRLKALFGDRRGPTRPYAEGTRPLRVLYALESYPQLSESYINAEIERMLDWGVHIEAWSVHEPSTPCPARVPVHKGKLAKAIRRVGPDVLHAHWTKSAIIHGAVAGRAGIPMTVRGHWHFVPEHFRALEDDDTVRRLYLNPHLIDRLAAASGKVVPMTSCYRPEWVTRPARKDRRLVVRTSATKKSKDLETFVRTAKRCPNHRFVMILCKLGNNPYYDELVAYNRDRGAPVEILCDASREEVAAIVGRAGVYLHTYNPSISFGMPVSIAEAMAAGSYVLARRVDGAAQYVGEAGRLYESDDEAVSLVRDTEAWSDEEWAAAEQRSTERARTRFDDRSVLAPLLEDWRRIAAERATPARVA